MKEIKLILFDDNSKVRDSIKMLFGGIPGISFLGAFADCRHLKEIIENTNPEVVLMDIDMPEINGIEAVTYIHKNYPHIKILMQTVFDDTDRIFLSICAGAHGYLLKNTPPHKIIEAVREVQAGGAPMTPEIASKVLKLLSNKSNSLSTYEPIDFKLSNRETEVLGLLVTGKAYKMIAAELDITYDTVRAHIKKIYEKLHVSSMTEAVSKALIYKIV